MDKEWRIYLKADNKLKLLNICQSDFAFINNISIYRKKYSKENVIVKKVEVTMDDEKIEWLNSLGKENF